jgi:dihydrolipoamide dehydrogenase
MMDSTDVLVIGGGPGGYTAAIRTAQRGRAVTLVDKGGLGGTCLNHGCIPSKALLTASNLVAEMETASEMGIYTEPYVDFGEMMAWKDDVVTRLTGGVETLCEANGVSLASGTARFIDERTAAITSADGTVDEIKFDNAIVATGSRPIELQGLSFDDDPILSSKQALDLETVPQSLAIIGAGYIGMELSSVFAKLGTDVTVIEMESDVLPGYDSELTEPVKSRAEVFGVDFEFGHVATNWEPNDNGGVTLYTEDRDGTENDITAERILVAVGREPVVESLDLEVVGIEPTDRGFLETDDRTRTDRGHIFAVGDIAGEPMLAHKASAEGIVAAETIAGNDASLNYTAIPTAVFVDPEIATVGVGKEQANSMDIDTIVGAFPFNANGRSLTLSEEEGFVRVVADGENHELLGAQIVGPDASELIGELGLAIEAGMCLEDLAETVHMHPTLSEAVMEACENALGQAIHTLNR